MFVDLLYKIFKLCDCRWVPFLKRKPTFSPTFRIDVLEKQHLQFFLKGVHFWKKFARRGYIVIFHFPFRKKQISRSCEWVKELWSKGVSIRFHFISEISFKLECCMHSHWCHMGTRLCHFLSLSFKPDGLNCTCFPSLRQKWREVKSKPQVSSSLLVCVRQR